MLKYTVQSENVQPTPEALKSEPIQKPLAMPYPNPSFTPFQSAPETLQNHLWNRILHYAMFIPELEADIYRKDVLRRLPLLLVSKAFNRLALPYYYSFVRLKDSSATQKFLFVLLQHPTIGARVRVIHGSLGRLQDPDTDPIPTILSLTTRLEQFHGYRQRFEHQFFWLHLESPALAWSAFEAMARSSGVTLREFSQEVHANDVVDPTVFEHLTQLTRLDWKCGRVKFDCGSEIVSYRGLNNLTDLRIWYLDPSFLTVLASMQLPSLRRLTLSSSVENATEFLRSCGRTLWELDLAHETVASLDMNLFVLCPSLTFLSVYCDDGIGLKSLPSLKDFVRNNDVHHCLQKVKFDLRYLQKTGIDVWDPVFGALEPAHFPRLREVHVECCVWPTTEREIAKSHWVRWAERFLKNGISMMDKNGKKWRARLGRA
ncbi:F-box domain-containing protein [Mycena venus]|uniref:F-box domain-containing protein n=1 Tax=Mycena venus TaxID=2733690 RepID=A0A8H6XFU9_9AGAR|nr:F-box domain-containing protein [Mycena venus]